MSTILVPCKKGWVNLDHVILVDHDNMALLSNNQTVELADHWLDDDVQLEFVAKAESQSTLDTPETV